jgi:hypothetical protein
MPQEEITPTSNEEIRRRMRALESEINNGPLVYELTDVASKNGIDPNYYNQEGVVSQSTD